MILVAVKLKLNFPSPVSLTDDFVFRRFHHSLSIVFLELRLELEWSST